MWSLILILISWSMFMWISSRLWNISCRSLPALRGLGPHRTQVHNNMSLISQSSNLPLSYSLVRWQYQHFYKDYCAALKLSFWYWKHLAVLIEKIFSHFSFWLTQKFWLRILNIPIGPWIYSKLGQDDKIWVGILWKYIWNITFLYEMEFLLLLWSNSISMSLYVP